MAIEDVKPCCCHGSDGLKKMITGLPWSIMSTAFHYTATTLAKLAIVTLDSNPCLRGHSEADCQIPYGNNEYRSDEYRHIRGFTNSGLGNGADQSWRIALALGG